MSSINAVKGKNQHYADKESSVVVVSFLHENAIKRLKEFMDADVDIDNYIILNEPTQYKQ